MKEILYTKDGYQYSREKIVEPEKQWGIELRTYAIGSTFEVSCTYEYGIQTYTGESKVRDGSILLWRGSSSTWFIPSDLRLLNEPQPEWGVDPKGEYVKGVTRFEVKAGEQSGVEWPKDATATFNSYDSDRSLWVSAECETQYGIRTCPINEKWVIKTSALRLIEPLPKPATLEEWCSRNGVPFEDKLVAVTKCVESFAGRMFKRPKNFEFAIDRILSKEWTVLACMFDSPRLAVFPTKEQVEDCFNLIKPYLDQITE